MATARIPSRASTENSLSWLVAGLADEMLACYVDWREHNAAVSDAYLRWSDAPARDGAWRFYAYLAALDQEESAAKSYALAAADLARLLQRAHGSRLREPPTGATEASSRTRSSGRE